MLPAAFAPVPGPSQPAGSGSTATAVAVAAVPGLDREKVDSELECVICRDYMVAAYSMAPCGHTMCVPVGPVWPKGADQACPHQPVHCSQVQPVGTGVLTCVGAGVQVRRVPCWLAGEAPQLPRLQVRGHTLLCGDCCRCWCCYLTRCPLLQLARYHRVCTAACTESRKSSGLTNLCDLAVTCSLRNAA